MTPWKIAITAADRSHAIRLIRRCHLPPFAEHHLTDLVNGEDYVHAGRRNPDRAFHLRAAGNDHGPYIDIDHASITYL